MRRSALLAVASGAVAMCVLGAPAAHAEGKGDIRVTKTVVNNGANVIVGTSQTITYPIAFTIKDNSGVKGLDHVDTFHDTADLPDGATFADWWSTSCVRKSSTTSVCTATMQTNPAWFAGSESGDPDAQAGRWTAAATVNAKDGDYWIYDRLGSYMFKRAAQLTTDAAPEPVAENGTLTVTGKLSRANWKDLKYHGYPGQSVKLQFKKAGAASYSTVKTVTTDNVGRLSTKVKATASGTWRWYFPGTTTTSLKVSTGDTVTVK